VTRRAPQAGTAEVEKMNEAGCSAVVGAYASAICLATTQAAAKYMACRMWWTSAWPTRSCSAG
jgi:hypothetical protein